MKKLYILFGLAALLAVIPSCKKGAILQGSEPVWLDGETLTFSVAAEGISTRSHFADDASTTPGSVASLVWDTDDAIGIIAVPFNEEIDDYDFSLVADVNHVAIAKYMKSENGKAIFAAEERNKTWWAAEGYTDNDCLYGIFAYYPAKEKIPFKLYAHNLDMFSGDDSGIFIDHVYSPTTNIPRNQDGVNYNNYHILFDISHFPCRSEGTEKKIDKTRLVTAATLKGSTAATAIPLEDFRPANALFAFNIKTADDYAGPVTQIDSVTVSADVVVTFEDDDSNSRYFGKWGEVSYYYHTLYVKFIGLTGTGIAPFAFSKQLQDHIEHLWNEDGEGDLTEFEKMMETGIVSANPKCLPYMDGLLIGDLYTDTSAAARFEQPVSVSTTATGPYYLATYPTYQEVLEEDCSSIDVIFRAYSGGKVVLQDRKTLPETGLKAGYRYNFTLTLGEGITFNGADAGSYTLVPEITL